jgi:hypothetical protein
MHNPLPRDEMGGCGAGGTYVRTRGNIIHEAICIDLRLALDAIFELGTVCLLGSY